MIFHELHEKLVSRSAPMPGQNAQLQMAPRGRGAFPDEQIIAGATQSAVLLLLYPKADTAHTVLIKRNAYEGVHSAQVSFPGGRQEQGETSERTALREAKEEVGIDTERVKLISQLTHLYIPPSKFLVHPFLATTNEQPLFVPDPKEVQSVIELDLAILMDNSIVKRTDMTTSSGLRMDVPYFEIQGHMVWGATAMILSELRELLRQLQ